MLHGVFNNVIKHLNSILLYKMVEESGAEMLDGQKNAFTHKRKMLKLSDGIDSGIDAIKNFMKKVFEDGIDRALIVSDCTCLIALPGLLQQIPHTDYNDTVARNNYIVFVSIFIGTKIIVFDEMNTSSEIVLNVGDVFVGRGDLKHAGAAYDNYNVRLHFYVTRNSCPVPKNVTYLDV